MVSGVYTVSVYWGTELNEPLPLLRGFLSPAPAPGTSTVDSTVDRFLSPRPIKFHLSVYWGTYKEKATLLYVCGCAPKGCPLGRAVKGRACSLRIVPYQKCERRILADF